MSPESSRGSAPAPLTAQQERALARKAAVAALTAVRGLRATPAEAAAGTAPGAPAAGVGDPMDGGQVGRAVGFASPQRAVRRRVRGSWAQRG